MSDSFLRTLRLNLLSAETRDIAVMHRPCGDDADLDAVAERIVTVGGVGVGFMPRNQIRIGTPIGFLAVEALEHFRIRSFVRAQVDMGSFETLAAAVGDFVDLAQDNELIRLGNRQRQLLFTRYLRANNQSKSVAVPFAPLRQIGDFDAHVADAPQRYRSRLRRLIGGLFANA